jgi:predicted adenylyl cyclase CyaB
MKREFELKAVAPGGAAMFRERLADAGWRLSFEGLMSDRVFDTPGRSLESRDEVLRIRCMTPISGESRTLLGWKGPASEEHGYKVRPELETVVEDTETAVAILENLGYSKAILAIDRRVAVYEKGRVYARIETYPAMDVLVELEGDPDRVEECFADLGLPREVWKPWPLDEFVRRYEERTGSEARLSGEIAGG